MKATTAAKLLARCFLFFAGAASLHWSWRIWVGLGQWERHFSHPIVNSDLWRYFASPLFPLIFVGSALLLVALGSHSWRFRRLVGAIALGVLFLALFTPDGFAHDMGHCMTGDCSEELGVVHLARCGSVFSLGFVGMALTDRWKGPSALRRLAAGSS